MQFNSHKNNTHYALINHNVKTQKASKLRHKNERRSEIQLQFINLNTNSSINDHQ